VAVESRKIRIAAAGDVHASEVHAERLEQAFARVGGEADLVLLAGDVTGHGQPEEAAVLARACRGLTVPVVAVLGNHDFHEGRQDEIASLLREAGLTVLDRAATFELVDGIEVGIAGTKGFVGGFAGSSLPDFGEPLLRQVYRETTDEVAALERGLQEIARADLRIALLHYAPTADTLEGEPVGIYTFLGCSRLATPIAEYQPDLVLHGHAHAGSFEGRIGEAPVYNVAVHVTGRDFYVFELDVAPRRPQVVEVEAPPA
jgi:Icc-related predicted phosphoesterase